MRTAWFVAALITSAVVAGLQQWALADFLYWRYEWFDLLMHFLGGLTIGCLTVAFLMRFRPIVFLVVLVGVAIGWEVFEALIGTPREANYFFDTSLDLLMDACGASVAYVLARFTIWRSN